jgi:nitroreductase
VPEFFDVVRSQRAHRRLSTDPVPESLIEQVIDAAVHAPSAENRQPWAFVVVRDPVLRAEVGKITAAMWEGGAREFSRPNTTEALFDEVDRWAMGGLAAAPVLVVVCGDTTLAPEMLLPSSIYPAVQNLLLAALAAGLGSLMSTLSIVAGPPIRSLLALPDHIVPMALVPLGYPVRPLGPPRRVPAVERMHRDRWGTAW